MKSLRTKFISALVAISQVLWAALPAGAAAPLPTPVAIAKVNLAALQQRLQPRFTRADTAARTFQGLAQIKSMPLRAGNTADLQAALTRLQSVPTLRGNYFDRLFKVAHDNAAFRSGIEAVVKRDGAKPWLARVHASSQAVLEIPGARQAIAEVERAQAADRAVLVDLAHALQAAAKLKVTGNARGPARPETDQTGAPLQALIDVLAEPAQAQVDPVSIAVIVGVVVLYALAPFVASEAYDDVQTSDNPPEQQHAQATHDQCVANADAKRDTCLRQAGGDWIQQAECQSVWLLRQGDCALFH
jgi:hypothetical protein